MADLIIAGNALQDVQIGAKTATSITSVTSVDGTPLTVGGEFASLIVQLLGSVDGEPAAAATPADGGKTLPPLLPQGEGEDPIAAPELLAALIGPAVVTPDKTVTTTGETEAEPESGDATIGALTLAPTSHGARRAHAALAEKLTPEKRDAAPMAAGERGGRLTAEIIDAAALKGAPDTQNVVTAAGVTTDPTVSLSVSTAAVPLPNGTTVAIAKAPMESAPIPIHQRGFEQALGDRVVWMTGNRIQSAELQVNPPELGPIEVRISVTNDQTSVSFGAVQPATRDALEAALPRLRELLSQQGLNLSDVNVSEHSQAQERGDAASTSAQSRGSGENGTEDAQESVRVTIGMLDVFA